MFNQYDDLVTIQELCQMLNIGRNMAYRLLKNGLIKSFKCGRTWKVAKAAVEDYIKVCSGL